MIVIPPSLPEPSQNPRRPEGAGVQNVPAVLADKAGVNPGVVLNLPSPVMEAQTDSMRARDAATQPAATQVDAEVVAGTVRAAPAGEADLDVRAGLNAAGLPERLVKLLTQLQTLAQADDAHVMWPAAEQLKAARPELALMNLRQALGNSMLFEVKRLQTRLMPSASPAVAPSTSEATQGATGMPSSEFAGVPVQTLLQARVQAEGQVQSVARGGGPELLDEAEALVFPGSGLVEGEVAELTETYGKPKPAQPLQQAPSQPAEAERADAVKKDEAHQPAVRKVLSQPLRDEALPSEGLEEGGLDVPLPQTAPGRTTEVLLPESQSIRDAVRLLLHGELRWQGELSPGVFARVEREDVWEENAQSPGALVKGTLVSVDMDLPTLGRVRVRGMFIKDAVRVSILPEEGARGRLAGEFADLRARLDARGLEGASVRLVDDERG